MQNSHEVLREAFDTCGPKRIASELGISLSTVYKWTQPTGVDQSGARNPLDRVSRLIEITDDRSLIQWLCHRGGGFFVEDPEGSQAARELLPATNETIREFARMISFIAQCVTDGQISIDEARHVRRRWEELKTIVEGFVRGCEEGRFEQLREAASHHLAEIEKI